ncbi:MAG: LysM peptidoglycan-binding domain-containing protein [Thermodesulfovibrio sp.]|nr:LysM peptidoglycan-binding domain-containing protein [Thermodesulfovibrio sp.]
MLNKIYIFIFSIILFPCIVFAQTYTVKNGDNLWEIAKKFNVSIDDIKRANNLKDKKLKVGMKLEIPDNKSIKVKNKSQTQNNDVSIQYHTVKKGENLFRIANKYNISVDELKRLNNLNKNKLSVGQKLIVKKIATPIENISIRTNERVPVLSAANMENETKLDEIEEIKASEDLSKLSITERILLFAKKMLHLPYRFGGNNFNGLDCSFFVKKVYSLVGIDLPRSAREQFAKGITIDKEELKPGDLVFFRTYAKFPSHVGIYIGDNLFIHASSKSKKVTIDSLDAPYYIKRFIGAKRILEIDSDAIQKAIEEVKKQES